MKKRLYFAVFVLGGIATLTAYSDASQQSDPFYINILEKAQRSFLAKNYQDAARDFEIAAFGLAGDKALQAKACVYLALCKYYIKDIAAAEECLRKAADMMGEEGFDSLEIYESAWPDLDKLISFFNLARNPGEALPKEVAKAELPGPEPPGKKPLGPAKKPGEKTGGGAPGDSGNGASANVQPGPKIDELKEGDLVPLDLVETQPVLIKSIPAVYPAYARTQRIEGTVIINALISEKGDVAETELVQGIKNAVGLDQSALKAVRQWKFEPASVKGIKVRTWLRVAIEFKLPTGLP